MVVYFGWIFIYVRYLVGEIFFFDELEYVFCLLECFFKFFFLGELGDGGLVGVDLGVVIIRFFENFGG